MNWLLLTVTLAGAGFIQGLSDFGFGLVSMSLMPVFMGIKRVAVISTAFPVVAQAHHLRPPFPGLLLHRGLK
jgi:hypothetical protein